MKYTVYQRKELHACSCQSIYEQVTDGEPVLKHQRFSKQLWPGERQVYFAGCRVQVAGRKVIMTGKPLALQRNVQLVELP